MSKNDLPQIDLLDLLDGTAERIEAAELLVPRIDALRLLWKQRHSVRPDGAPLPVGQGWCGRCGQNTFAYGLTINHDLGYCGCPVEVDPTWSRYPRRADGRGFRGHGAVGHANHGLLTVDELCDRWDRQYFPDCTCGHPWGVHCRADHPTFDFACGTSCGCSIYTEGPVQ